MIFFSSGPGDFNAGGGFVGQGYSLDPAVSKAERRSQYVTGIAGEITGMRVILDEAPDPAGNPTDVQKWLVVMRLNGGDTPIRCIIKEQQTSCKDVADLFDDVAIAPGDKITIQIREHPTSTGFMNDAHISIMVQFQPN